MVKPESPVQSESTTSSSQTESRSPAELELLSVSMVEPITPVQSESSSPQAASLTVLIMEPVSLVQSKPSSSSSQGESIIIVSKELLQFDTPVPVTEPNAVKLESKAIPAGADDCYLRDNVHKVYYKNDKVLDREQMQLRTHLPSEFGCLARDVNAQASVQKRRRIRVTEEQKPPIPAHFPSSTEIYSPEGTDLLSSVPKEGTESEEADMYRNSDQFPSSVHFPSNVPGMDMSVSPSTTASTSAGTPQEESSSPVFRDATEEELEGFEFQDYAKNPTDDGELDDLPQLAFHSDKEAESAPRQQLSRAVKKKFDKQLQVLRGYIKYLESTSVIKEAPPTPASSEPPRLLQ